MVKSYTENVSIFNSQISVLVQLMKDHGLKHTVLWTHENYINNQHLKEQQLFTRNVVMSLYQIVFQFCTPALYYN